MQTERRDASVRTGPRVGRQTREAALNHLDDTHAARSRIPTRNAEDQRRTSGSLWLENCIPAAAGPAVAATTPKATATVVMTRRILRDIEHPLDEGAADRSP